MQGFLADNITLFIWAIFFVISLFTVDGFATPYNLKSYLINCAALLIPAMGLTFPLLNGGLDMSMTAVISFVSTISAYILVSTELAGTAMAIPVAIIVSVLIGAVVGAVNGLSVVKLKMPSFVASLSTMLIVSGMAVWFGSVYYEKVSLNGLPKAFLIIGGNSGCWYVPVLIAAVLFIISNWLLTKTLFGKQVYAVGINPKAAEISGIPVKRTIFLLSLISGIFASLAGIMFTAKNGAGITTLGDGMFINYAGAVVVGGTKPSGGFGGVRQTLYGVLFIMWLSNILNLFGIEYTLYDTVKGVFILLAVVMGLYTNRLRTRAAVLASR